MGDQNCSDAIAWITEGGWMLAIASAPQFKVPPIHFFLLPAPAPLHTSSNVQKVTKFVFFYE